MEQTPQRRRRRRAEAAPSSDAAPDAAGYSLDEPTLAEKLAALDPPADAAGVAAVVPPSADSVHVLLRQALQADDRAALLGCLYNRDGKVIVKSVSLLTPADAVKFLKSMVSLMQSRGSVLVCLLPWLQALLGRHMSSIVSQESSLLLLNSLYQLIDARTSTFASLLKLSTCLDYHFSEICDDGSDEEEAGPPLIYEDMDSDEEDSEVDDAMETEDKGTDKEESEVDDE
ncbi:U3 small nucleolar RNA-associated protein 5 [Hordeum vulgare]|nr:U3 small nucleolar RNA-associated protein 5 [Hordeum vulgare]